MEGLKMGIYIYIYTFSPLGVQRNHIHLLRAMSMYLLGPLILIQRLYHYHLEIATCMSLGGGHDVNFSKPGT